MKIVYRQRRPVAFIALVFAGIVPEGKLRNRMEERRTLIRLFPLLAFGYYGAIILLSQRTLFGVQR